MSSEPLPSEPDNADAPEALPRRLALSPPDETFPEPLTSLLSLLSRAVRFSSRRARLRSVSAERNHCSAPGSVASEDPSPSVSPDAERDPPVAVLEPVDRSDGACVSRASPDSLWNEEVDSSSVSSSALDAMSPTTTSHARCAAASRRKLSAPGKPPNSEDPTVPSESAPPAKDANEFARPWSVEALKLGAPSGKSRLRDTETSDTEKSNVVPSAGDAGIGVDIGIGVRDASGPASGLAPAAASATRAASVTGMGDGDSETSDTENSAGDAGAGVGPIGAAGEREVGGSGSGVRDAARAARAAARRSRCAESGADSSRGAASVASAAAEASACSAASASTRRSGAERSSRPSALAVPS